MNAHPRPRPGMVRISLFGIAALMLTGIVAWASPTHSAVKRRNWTRPDRPFFAHGERKEFAQSGIAHFADVAG